MMRLTTVCAIRSDTVGIPSFLVPPFAFGISTCFTGGGKYDPDDIRFHNLYKLWNRMSSGSYFPPPVKQGEISKAKGGTRRLGVPTVSDRIAQNAGKNTIEPILDPIFHQDSYGYRPGRSAKQAIAVTRKRRWP